MLEHFPFPYATSSANLNLFNLNYVTTLGKHRDSSVIPVTGYLSDDRCSNPDRGREFSLRHCCVQTPYRMGTDEFLQTLTVIILILCRGQEYAKLYLHSPIRLHDVTLTYSMVLDII